MKKIKKYYPLIVGLVLLISVAAYGTRAYFSDSTEQEAGIELTLGSLDITGNSKKWVYKSESGVNNNIDVLAGEEEANTRGEVAENNQELEKIVNIENARPGDSFSKIFTFENTGSLDQKINFSSSNNNANPIFYVTWELDDRLTSEENVILIAKNGSDIDSVTATMTVTIKTDGNHVYEKTDSSNLSTIVPGVNQLINETVTVTAEQTNVVTNSN